MVEIQVTGATEIAEIISQMARDVTPQMVETMQTVANEVQAVMQSNIPSKSGSLAQSITIDYNVSDGSVEAHIGPSDDNFEGRAVGRSTELGRTPGGGFPNWFDIANRYGVSLGVAYAIAKKIQQDGSRGIFYVSETMQAIESLVIDRAIAMAGAIVSGF